MSFTLPSIRPLAMATLAASLSACGGAELPVAPPPAPPPPPVTTSTPAAPAQAFAQIETELVFTDPDRKKKLASAFPAIDALVEAAVRDRKLPGIELAVVLDDGLAHAKGAGVVDLKTRIAPDADTVFRLGSVTKAFTALAVLALRDDGALSLDDPLTRLVPEAAGLVYPTRDTPPITLRQLLTHTSGLPWNPPVETHRLEGAITEAGRSTVREAHAPATISAPLRVRMREAAAPGESLVTALAGSYGYGWMIDEGCELDRIVGHGGSIDGYSTSLALLPEHGVGVVALTNYLRIGENLDGLVQDVLRALKKTGGLEKRAMRAKELSPALAIAMKRLLAVQNAWSREDYEAMLSKRRQPSLDEERAELAGYRATHGACKGSTPAVISSPYKATFALQCERGALEMLVELNPADDLVQGFLGTSRDVPPPPKLAAVAERLAGLVGKWDDGLYRTHLAPKVKKPRAEVAASFERLRAVHGACKVKSFSRWSNRPDFLLACDRGGDVTLTLSLDEKNEDAVASYQIMEEGGGGACPVK